MKPAAILLAAAGIYAVGDAVLAPTPTPEHPGFVDAVLASRAVMASIRLAIIFAGVYVVVSVVALITRGQWLTRVGPVEVSERVADADTEVLRLKAQAAQDAVMIDKLRQRIAAINELLGR
jgi:ABC-type protease/lipase transport system fused ATPase/permease subunit